MAGRGLAWIARNGPKANLKGCVLACFNKGNKVTTAHPLDTNRDEYLKVLRDVVVPTCQEITPDLPEYQKRMHDVMISTNSQFDQCWNFGCELIYRMVAPESEQTPENLMKMRILRYCSTAILDFAIVLDDITDESEMRGLTPCWYKVCPGGMYSAIYDAVVLGQSQYFVLKKFFRDHPGYRHMLEGYTQGAVNLMIGENLDNLNQKKPPNLYDFHQSNFFKAGCTFIPQATMGAAFAGICEDDTIQKLNEVFITIGRISQLWDDFNDYYSSAEATGKRCDDFKNGTNTWASATAFEMFNPEQKKRFMELYGSPDPENHEAVKKMYDEIDLPRIYLKSMVKEHGVLKQLIEKLPSDRLQTACFSYADWFLGDICDPEFARELNLSV